VATWTPAPADAPFADESGGRAPRWPARWLRRVLGNGDPSIVLTPDVSPQADGAAPSLASGTPSDPAGDASAPEPAPEQPYAVGWLGHNLPGRWPEEEPFYAYVGVQNRGTRTWRATPEDGHAVSLVVRLDRDVHAMPTLPHDVAPGEQALIGFPLELPKGLGDWELSFSFVEQNVAWFDQQGVAPLRVSVGRALAESTALSHARRIARRVDASFYSPSQFVARSRDGRAFPVVVQEAAGARVRDADGNTWIDYVMGWGSALLGYANPEVRAAVAEMLDCGPILSLPHMLEMEVADALCELIPCAEQVLFGRNGSDACTAAVRAARLHTGRDLVLFSGYHGWQEPFASTFEPALRAPGTAPGAISFRLNDLEGLCGLVKAHAGQIAAVMLEPSAQAEGVEGPVRDCDPAFLRQVAEICREQGAVLIFDEIMTGFRYPRGSVQRATGVIPDLAVFGKALAAGFPLAALVGRQAILGPTLSRLFYHPTFKGDAYAFAAASAALRIYRTRDIAREIREIGTRLQAGVASIGRELGIDGGLIGLPYRMVYRFEEPEERRRTRRRTLLQQELLKHGVLTFKGFMLPSIAHGDEEIDRTLAAFRAALTTVAASAHDASIASDLEIPPVR
jgi:glutamate-1-semialdehyde 2,1-aminomutase